MGGVFGGGSSSSSSASNSTTTSVAVDVSNAVNIDTKPVAEALDRLISVQRDAMQTAAVAQVTAATVQAKAQEQALISQQDAERLKLLFAGVSAAAAIWAATKK